MTHWVRYPFLRLTIALVAGIMMGQLFLSPAPFGGTGILVFVCWFVLVFRSHRGLNTSGKKVACGMLGLLSILFFGIQRATDYPEIIDEQHFQQHLPEIQAFVGRVSRPIEESNRRRQIQISISKIKKKSAWLTASGSLLIFHQTERNETPMRYGDLIMGICKIRETTPPRKSGDLDYKAVLARRNIYYVAWSNHSNTLVVQSDKLNSPLAFVQNLRKRLKDVIIRDIPTTENQGVALALLLGYRKSVSSDQRNNYSKSGAAHLLAVSGLHVGLICMVMMGFFKLIGRDRSLSSLVLQLFAIGLYALITGASPSVLRAAFMFSILLLGRQVNRSNNILNSLSFTAFCLLVTNPPFLFQIGFQLSFLAVLGIACFQSRLHSLVTPSSALGSWIWDITTISISAQILTTPLVIFYFNQFPLLSIVTNILTLPLITMVLWGGLLMLSLGWLPDVSSILGIGLSWILDLMNLATYHIAHLRFSTMGISLDLTQTIFLFTTIAVGVAFLRTRKFVWLLISVLSAILLLSIKFYHLAQVRDCRRVILNADKAVTVELVTGSSSSILDPNSSQSELTAGLKLAWSNGKRWRLLVFGGISFLWIRNGPAESLPIGQDPIMVDYLIVPDCSVLKMDLQKQILFENLVIGPMAKPCASTIEGFNKSLNFSVHQLSKGALQIDIK